MYHVSSQSIFSAYINIRPCWYPAIALRHLQCVHNINWNKCWRPNLSSILKRNHADFWSSVTPWHKKLSTATATVVMSTAVMEMPHLVIIQLAKRKHKLSLCLTKHHAMKTCRMSGGIAPRIFNLGTRWRWLVRFMLRPLYTRGKRPRYPLDRRIGGPQRRCGCGGEKEENDIIAPAGNWTPVVQPAAQSLYWLSYPSS
jgi:hypothetical protein